VPSGNRAVGLDGEADQHRDTGPSGSASDPDAFLGAGQRVRRDQVGARGGERLHLSAVVVSRLVRVGLLARDVAVAARADSANDPHVLDVGVGLTQLVEEPDRCAVHAVERGRVVPHLGPPVRVRTPSRRLQSEARAGLASDGGVPVVVGPQQAPAALIFDERERGERGEIDAVVEDQVGFQAAIADEAAGEPGQVLGTAHDAPSRVKQTDWSVVPDRSVW